MDVVCFGQQNWDVCWTAKQQLLTRLARRGHRVLYLDPILGTSPAAVPALYRWVFPEAGAGAREVEDGLWVYTHHAAPPIGRRLNARLRRPVTARVAQRLGMRAPVALVLSPYGRWLSEGIPAAARVYYAVDEWTAFGGLEAHREWLRREEEALLRGADVALAVSPRLLQRFKTVQPRSYLLQNAADVDHFSPQRLAASAPHPALAALPRPRVGFVGQVDERLDQDLLVYLSGARPHWQFVLAGRVKEGVDVSRIAGRGNIQLLGYQPYVDLPSVLSGVDACVVPYRLTTLTQSCNPLKVYEYLATGLPVVATPLEGLNACRDAVVTADSPEAFLDALDAAIADPSAGREGRLVVARDNAWDARTSELEDRLEEALRLGSARDGSAAQRRLVPARGAKSLPLRLDAKDESERQLRKPFHRPPLALPRRALFELTRAAGFAYYGVRVAGRFLGGRRPVAVRRILVVRHTRLGDLLVYLPTLAALRRKYPHAKIVLGVQPDMSAGELLAPWRDVDEVRVLDFMSRPSRVARYRGAWELFREGYDLMVCGVSYFLIRDAFYCGAPRRLGLYDGHPLQRLNSHLLPLDPSRHETDNNLALVETLGCTSSDAERVPVLKVDPSALAGAAATLASQLSVPADATVVTIHPGSNRPSRRWPADRFAALAEALLSRRPDAHVVLTGVTAERDLAESIRVSVPAAVRHRVHALAGDTGLAALVALLDRSAAVVCNDTGVMHLARARGRPLLALLGPENDRRWGPYPLGVSPAVALRSAVPCAPCVRWDCDAHYCMRSLSVEEAFVALDRLLTDAPPAERQRAPGEPVLLPLRRVVRHRRWSELAAAQMPLPLVTAVILTDRTRRRGTETAASAAPGGEAYPNVQWLRAPSGPPGETWHAALAQARGEFFMVADSEEDTLGPRVGEQVAALVRTPDAVAAYGGRVFTAASVAELHLCPGAPPPPGLLLRAAAIRESCMDVMVGTAVQKVVPSSIPVAPSRAEDGMAATAIVRRRAHAGGAAR